MKVRPIFEIILLILGLSLTVWGILNNTLLGKTSIGLGALAFISSYISSRSTSIRLKNIEDAVGASEVVKYVPSVYELYKNSTAADTIYSCTSSWLVSPDIRKSLLAINAEQISFLGPIISDRQIIGALFRYWISSKRKK